MTLAQRRARWNSQFATQPCTIYQPGSGVKNAWGIRENVGERDVETTCKVIGPSSQAREVIEGDQVVGMADFEVRLPWDVANSMTILTDARVEVNVAGLLHTYRVLGVDRGRPNAWYLGLFCVRVETRTNDTIE